MSESEPSHSGAGTALSEEAGAPALILSGAKGPAGGQAQWGSGGARPPSGRLHWPEASASRSLPIAGPGNSGGTPRRDGGQVSQGWQHVQAAAHGPAGKLCGSQTPQVPLELQDWQTAENFLKEGTLSCSAAAEPRGQVGQPLQGALRGCAGVASPPPWSAPPGWPSTTWASSFVRILLPWTCLGQSLAPFLICLETDQQAWGAKHQVSAACGAAGPLQSWGASGSPPQGKGGCEDRAGRPGCLASKAALPPPLTLGLCIHHQRGTQTCSGRPGTQSLGLWNPDPQAGRKCPQPGALARTQWQWHSGGGGSGAWHDPRPRAPLVEPGSSGRGLKRVRAHPHPTRSAQTQPLSSLPD